MAELKTWIKEQGMTQRAFAQRMKVTEAYVSQLATGLVPMTGNFREKFLRTFGYEAYVAVFGDGCAEATNER